MTSSDNRDISEQIRELLGSRLANDQLEVDVVPIPAGGDRMVRLRTLEDALQSTQEGDGFIVHVRPRPVTQAAEAVREFENETAATEKAASGEGIYRQDGKLNTQYLLRNAELLFSSGDYPLARNIFKAILQSGERTAIALHGTGRCYEAEGKLEEARINYEESIAYHPNLDVYRHLASLLIRQKKDQNAAEVLERALNLKDIPLALRLDMHKAAGNCWTRAQINGSAERHFLRALELDPAQDEIRSNLGALHLQAGKVSEAKRSFQDAIASNPRNALAYAGLAGCLLAEGMKREAHDAFARSLEIQLNNPQALFQLVKLAYELKTYATAARILEDYTQAAPVNANLLYSLSGLQFHLGRIDDSRTTANRILEMSPHHAGAKDLLTMMERFKSN